MTKEYYCSICNYTNDIRQHLVRHTEKKNVCGKNPKVLERDVDIYCEHCGNKYSSVRSLKEHIKKSCKVIKANEAEKLKQQVKELQTKLVKAEAEKKLAEKPNQTLKLKNTKMVINNKTVINKTNKSKIRIKARGQYKEKFDMVCLHCGHERGIQVCHIKELHTFEEDENEYTINNITNLIGLCANCHYDLDKAKLPDVLKTIEIYKRMLHNCKVG